MATTIQHSNSSMILMQQDEDIALANYLTKNHHHHRQTQQYYKPRSRTTSTGNNNGPTNIPPTRNTNPLLHQQKSRNSSITNVSAISTHSNSAAAANNNRRRNSQHTNTLVKLNDSSSNAASQPSTTSFPQYQLERRPSVSSSVISSSGFSVQSEMSANTKVSLKKRIRKVLSLSNMKGSNSNISDLTSLKEDTRSNSVINSSRNNSSISLSSTATFESSPLSQKSSVTSISKSTSSSSPMSFRRRSIASLSSLFQKGAKTSIPEEPTDTKVTTLPTTSTTSAINKNSSNINKRHSSGNLRQLAKKETKKKPELRVDTAEVNNDSITCPVSTPTTMHNNGASNKKGAPKVRSSLSTANNNSAIAPDSPNSVISSRSSFKQPRNLANNESIVTALPSPNPSIASSTSRRQQAPTTTEEGYFNHGIGFHYNGLHLHGSPKLKPASSSTSSLAAVPTIRSIQFNTTVQVHETFSAGDYDRRCDTNSTCQRLTPIMAMKIKQELNEYKLTEMEVHVESRQFTHFFL